MATPQVVCFGEILWDMLPSGKLPGGAPMNVAFQLNQLGIPAAMISRVGVDDLGREITAFLQEKNVPLELVQYDEQYPTSTVQVSFDEKGHPQYVIVQPVAWDFIEAEATALAVVRQTAAFVFGSLTARGEPSKTALLALIQQAPVRVFDVNLRRPFYSKALLDDLLPLAHIVKMNDDELDIIAGWYGFAGDQKEKMLQLKKAGRLELLVVTRGDKGAIGLDGAGFCEHPGYSVHVQDTIGSGDAFLAGYLSGFLNGLASEACLDFGCKMGAYVATQRGGTPALNRSELSKLLQTEIV